MKNRDENIQSQRDIRSEQRRERRSARKEETKKHHTRGREIFAAGYLMVAVFIAMLGYFIWFEASGKNDVLVNRLNNRTANMQQSVRKGDIVSSDGVVLATTQNREDGSEYRYYPFSNMFAHTLGYATKGGAGLEGAQKIRLLMSHDSFLLQLKTELMNQKIKGDTMHVTLDYAMQSYCYELLGGRSGAIVAIEPKTGRVIAMVSCPDFDPNTIDEQWSYLVSEENKSGNLMSRASQGVYPPGSTFKMITLLEYIRENPDTWRDFTYTCNGVYIDGEYTVNCHDGHAHGELDIYGALAQSCNGAFITMGRTLDPVRWRELAEDFGYNQSESLDVQYKKSSFPLTQDAGEWDMIQASIGQGTTLTTPLLNTMITGAIANGGVMMKPYLLEEFASGDGSYRKTVQPQELRRCISSEEAELLSDFMMRVVRDGSGAQASCSSCQVAGKTGSAQFSSQAGLYHAWFTGFAPMDDPQLAVTVIVEAGGAGGEVAAPMAGAIFEYYFSLQAQRQAQ